MTSHEKRSFKACHWMDATTERETCNSRIATDWLHLLSFDPSIYFLSLPPWLPGSSNGSKIARSSISESNRFVLCSIFHLRGPLWLLFVLLLKSSRQVEPISLLGLFLLVRNLLLWCWKSSLSLWLTRPIAHIRFDLDWLGISKSRIILKLSRPKVSSFSCWE